MTRKQIITRIKTYKKRNPNGKIGTVGRALQKAAEK